MDITPFRPILSLILLIAIVGLACTLGSSEPTPVSTPTDVPTSTDAPPLPTPTPTAPPPPTNTPAPPPPTDVPPPTATTEQQIVPTDTPATSNDPLAYYVEEFEGDLSSYSYIVFNGVDRGSEMVFTKDGALAFSISDQDTWVYVTYDPWVYRDVRIGLSAENRGVNSQRVSLLCRLSADGWFEFNIGGDGLWEVWVYDDSAGDFFLIGNGGSTDINLGQDTNIYVAECIGNDLTLYINGVLVRTLTIPANYSFLEEGEVGFAVSSFDAVPVNIHIGWFGIESP
ncbi:MAG TPA: hypothetical protein VMN57_07105 [Anaerolineales bacterium]|nr:hypothetical protein [Anaerolineales bacterium]